MVVEAKLRTPRRRVDEVPRSLLVETLRTASVPVVAVRAGAGYGKTITVRQWVHADPRDAAWLTVDAGDNDPVSLLRHVVRALDGIVALPEVEALLAVEPPPVERVVLTELASALGVDRPPLVLVLDDVHLLTEAAAGRLLEWLVAALPAGSTLALVGRAMPPMHLTRHLVSDDAMVLRRADLAFTAAECRAATRRALPDLDHGAVERLWELSEGWPAGLYLALLALKTATSPDAVIADLPARAENIGAYFHEELLQSLAPEVRAFLVRTSVLGRLSGELCDAVLGRTGSGAVLRALAASDNLFVVALDDEPDWYRYHHLFADLLVAELRVESPQDEPALRRRAARWLSDHGLSDEAVRQSLAAGDEGLAAEIAHRYACARVQGGQIATLERWLDAFAPATVLLDPLLGLISGWVAMARGRSDDVAGWLALLAEADRPGPLPDGTASLAVAGAALAMFHGAGGVLRTAADARTVRQAGPGGSPWWSTACLFEATATQLADADADAVALHGAAEFATRADPAAHPVALAHLAWAHFAVGDQVLGQQHAAQAVAELRARNLDDFTLTTHVHVVHAYAAAMRGDHAEAEAACRHARGLLDELSGTVPRSQCQMRLVLVDAALVCHQLDLADTLLTEAEAFLAAEPDAVVLWAWAERLRGVVGSRGRDRRTIDRLGLTTAELRVLAELPTHRSLEEIGEVLYVSRNTVKTHVVAIYRKLGVSARSAAVDRGRELGLVDDAAAPAG